MTKHAFLFLLSISLITVSYAQQKAKPAAKKSTTKPASSKPAVIHKTGVVPKNISLEKDTFVDIITGFGTIEVRLYKETPLHRSNFIKLASQGFYDSLLFHRVIKQFMVQGGDPTSKNANPDAMLGGGDIGYKIPAEFNKKYYHKKGALAAARDGNPEMASSGCQFYIVQGKKFDANELSNIANGMNYNRKMMMLQEYTSRDSVKTKLDDYNTRGDQAGLENYMKEVKAHLDAEFEPLMYIPTSAQVGDYMKYGGAPHLDGTYTVFGEVISGWEIIDKMAEVKTNSMNRPIDNIPMVMKIVVK